MSAALTTEQSERIERILRAIGDSLMSTDAVNELREKMTWSLANPQPPGEVHRICEELRRELGTFPINDALTSDEILGYDDFGLPT